MMRKKKMEVDRLSDLPDPVIHHIFSYLDDMKAIVQTSILSNRWRNLWKSTPYLNFDLTTLPVRLSRFISFVDHFLSLADAPTIFKFSLSCWELRLEGDYLHRWLLAAIERNVQELSLDVSVAGDAFELPHHLFTSNLLSSFDLYYLGTNHLQIPNSLPCATRLRTLRLRFVKLPEGSREGKLSLRFSVLEELVMDGGDHRHLTTLTLSTPLLRRLELSSACAEEITSCALILCAPRLTSLVCRGYIYREWTWLDEVISLVTSASICLCGRDPVGEEVYANYLIKLLNGLPNLASLTISNKVLEIIIGSPNIMELLQTVFGKLRELKLDEWGKTSPYAIANLLVRLPRLEAFVWDRTKCTRSNPDWEEEDWREDLFIYTKLHGLKSVKIERFCGTEGELLLVEFILENGAGLKEMVILTNIEDRKELKRLKEKLLPLQEAFPNVLLKCHQLGV